MSKRILVLFLAFFLLPSTFSSSPAGLPDNKATPLPPTIVTGNNPAIDLQQPMESMKLGKSGSITSPSFGCMYNLIPIAISSAQERAPKVASCGSGNEYLVVYEEGGDIYGKRIGINGDVIGSSFMINTGDDPRGHAWEPDVGCEMSHDRKIVVWAYDVSGSHTNHDLHVQSVYNAYQSEGSQLAGSMVILDETPEDERRPAIACSLNAATCLVTFDYSGSGNGDIRGRLLGIGDLAPTVYDDTVAAFPIGALVGAEYNSDVAWDSTNGRYMVVWQYMDPAPDPDAYRIVYAVVYDQDQLGSMVEIPADYAISGSAPKDQTHPVVAYNPRDNNYFVTFEYAFSESDMDIYGQYLSLSGGIITHIGNYHIYAASEYPEYLPAVAWSGGSDAFTNWGGADQFGLTYIEKDTDAGIYYLIGAAINHLPEVPYLLEYEELGGISFGYGYLSSTSICGSSETGRYLVAEQISNYGPLTTDDDIWGMILVPLSTYLPLIRKP